jgi:hypothetical protein
MYENRIMKPINIVSTRGEIRKRNREGEYDHGTLYAWMEVVTIKPLYATNRH